MNFKDFEQMHYWANIATIRKYGCEAQIVAFNKLCDAAWEAGLEELAYDDLFKATDIEIVQWIMQRADLILARQPR